MTRESGPRSDAEAEGSKRPNVQPGGSVQAIGLGLLSALLFGASTPASKLLLESLGPFQLAGLLYLGAALGMAIPLARERARRGRAPDRGTPNAGAGPVRLDRTNLLRLAGAVTFGGVVGPVLLLFALTLTLAGSVSLLLNFEMAATAVLGVFFFHEHLGRLGWLGVAGVVFSGVLLASGGGWPGWLAAALVAAGCLCWGLDNHWTALIDGITPQVSTFWKGAVAGTTNLSIGLVLEPFEASSRVVAIALGVGTLSYGASIALYITSAQDLGATRAQAVFASAPFIGAALSFLLLGEVVTSTHFIASLLLVGSVIVLFLSQHEHRHVHEATQHVHTHRHDDGHHQHEHEGVAPATRHTHWHRHERLVHAHPHWPDIHHRHRHGSQG